MIKRKSKRMHTAKKLTSALLATGVFLVGTIITPVAVFAQDSEPAPTQTQTVEKEPDPAIDESKLPKSLEQSQRDKIALLEQTAETKADTVAVKEVEVQKVVEEAKVAVESKEAVKTEVTSLKSEIEQLKQKVAEKKAREAREAAQASQLAAQASTAPRYSGSYGGGNGYDYGYCTWYVKERRGSSLPNNLGNANTWYARAQAQGMAVGSAPRAGAVGTTTRGSLGHVVYVERVNADGSIYISEMNYEGFGIVSYRTTSASEFVYIY